MQRNVIQPAGTGPNAILSPGIRVGDLIWTAGSTGRNPDTGVTPDDIQGQTRQTLENLKRVVEAAGSSFASVIKVNIYLTEIGDRPAVNEIYKEYFPSNPPGRTCIGGAQFDGNTIIEIEMVAVAES
jgi:2-iminobutanoate/2-iminopropanoate deaminase